MAKIAIAGARGFVGSRLARVLGTQHSVVGFTRSKTPRPQDGVAEWRQVDLLSLKDAEAGLLGVDSAYYLVHSMMPSGGMTQGSFQDIDLISADNFARAAKHAGLKQIIYLGGIVPPAKTLSSHLQSRLEVEAALAAWGTPLTALRAGMVVGAGGSSFEILRRLVGRLPFMICPAWMETRMQPIALDDVVALLAFALGREPGVYDVGGPDALSYNQMVLQAAEVLGVKRTLVPVPVRSTRLSVLWIRLITGAPRALIRPLVDSLTSEMVAARRDLQETAGIPGMRFRDAFRKAVDESRGEKPVAFTGAPEKKRDVRSVQRLPLPAGRDAGWVGKEYVRWLASWFPFRVDKVLKLEFSVERSTPERALYYIKGGWLARVEGRGRLEFRETPDRQSVLAAVHEYQPRLPWSIYRWTQAFAHLVVMWAFGRHLATLATPRPDVPRRLVGTDTK